MRLRRGCGLCLQLLLLAGACAAALGQASKASAASAATKATKASAASKQFTRPRLLPSTSGSCGTNTAFVAAECVTDGDTGRVLDLRLTSSDGATFNLCSPPAGARLVRKALRLTPGTGIFSVRACSRWYGGERGVAGLMLAAVGQTLVCGDPYNANADCADGRTPVSAPLADVTASCTAGGLGALTSLCFNELYVPPNPLVPEEVCPAGQGRTTPGQPCRPCARGSYSPGGQDGPCIPCPSGLVTLREGSTQCGCLPGYGASPTADRSGLVCQPCKPGFFGPGGTALPCIRCPGSPFLTTPTGASSVTQCVCQPGYGSTPNNPRTCELCPIGTWSDATMLFTGPELQYGSPSGNTPDPAQSPAGGDPGVVPFTNCCTAWNFGKGKGKGGCPYCNPTWKACTPCCQAGDTTCLRTTKHVGSTRLSDCFLPCISCDPVTTAANQNNGR